MSYLEQLFSLDQKVAVVTGASRGLGQGIAAALLKAGATTVLVSTNQERLDATHQDFVAQNLKATAHACDLSVPEQLDTLVDHVIAAHGRIDVLVNAAGVTFTEDLLDYPDEYWEKTLRVNLEAPYRLVKNFARTMKEQGGGSIINITSIAAERGGSNNPAYAAAKGGLKQMTKALASDLAPFGIRVNNIGPGYFRTDMTNYSWDDPERRAMRTQSTMLGRWGMPADLAGIAVLLASDASSYITGQDFYVDGGWLAKI
jgi:NAD(P)-dependent dehydrogenase (short-subunit alcohol dehydrogenase family)